MTPRIELTPNEIILHAKMDDVTVRSALAHDGDLTKATPGDRNRRDLFNGLEQPSAELTATDGSPVRVPLQFQRTLGVGLGGPTSYTLLDCYKTSVPRAGIDLNVPVRFMARIEGEQRPADVVPFTEQPLPIV